MRLHCVFFVHSCCQALDIPLGIWEEPGYLLDKFFRHLAFLNEAIRATSETFVLQGETAQLRDDQDSKLGENSSKFSRCFQPAHARHAQITQHQVRDKMLCLSQQLFAIPCGSDDLEDAFEFQVLADRSQSRG